MGTTWGSSRFSVLNEDNHVQSKAKAIHSHVSFVFWVATSGYLLISVKIE